MAKLRPAKSIRANFRRLLPRLLRRYFRRGHRLVKSRATVAELHRFRIRTKRMRYIAELYQPLFPQPMTRAVLELQAIQEILGSLQDQAMVVANFERRLASVRNPARQSEYQRVLHRARARQNTHRETFVRRWKRLERTRFEKRLLAEIKNT